VLEKIGFLRPVAVFDQTWPLLIAYREIFLKKEKIQFFFREKSVEKIPSKKFFHKSLFHAFHFYHPYVFPAKSNDRQNKPISPFLKSSKFAKHSFLTSIFSFNLLKQFLIIMEKC